MRKSPDYNRSGCRSGNPFVGGVYDSRNTQGQHRNMQSKDQQDSTYNATKSMQRTKRAAEQNAKEEHVHLHKARQATPKRRAPATKRRQRQPTKRRRQRRQGQRSKGDANSAGGYTTIGGARYNVNAGKKKTQQTRKDHLQKGGRNTQ